MCKRGFLYFLPDVCLSDIEETFEGISGGLLALKLWTQLSEYSAHSVHVLNIVKSILKKTNICFTQMLSTPWNLRPHKQEEHEPSNSVHPCTIMVLNANTNSN